MVCNLVDQGKTAMANHPKRPEEHQTSVYIVDECDLTETLVKNCWVTITANWEVTTDTIINNVFIILWVTVRPLEELSLGDAPGHGNIASVE